jgi:hypothetical protein
LVVAPTSICVRTACAFTPESPEVVAMVNKGLKFLAEQDDTRLGGKCLIGLVFVKAEQREHPTVARAVAECRSQVARGLDGIKADIYSTGIAIIFLCELDPAKYQKEIETLLASLLKRQKPHGGWGYDTKETGDTSMTQYGVLSTWTALKKKIKVPRGNIEAACNWLLRTQDPSGAWGYQGVDPGNFQRVPQESVRLSLATAGLGSVYVCADALELESVKQTRQRKRTKLPPALKLVQEKKPDKKRAPAVRVDVRAIHRAETDGNAWFENNFKIELPQWTHYYMYALERYMSFRELAENTREKNLEPRWYNEGVRYLQRTMREDGSWRDPAGGGEAIDSSFALLFLMRSTQKTIDVVSSEGMLVGGRGLPANTSNLMLSRGRLIGKPLTTSATDVLAILEDPDHPDFDYVKEFPGELVVSGDTASKKAQRARLLRLLRSPNYEPRQLAVKTLASQRNFTDIPHLIFALSDPDVRVVREARDGLRFIARKFDGFDLPDRPTEEQQKKAIESWKQWYLAIRPDAEFPE